MKTRIVTLVAVLASIVLVVVCPTHAQDWTFEIYRINANGTGLKQLTHLNAYLIGPVTYSPNGSKLLFTAEPWNAPEFSIFMMDSDGSGMKYLAGYSCAVRAVFTPDGKKILFEGVGPEDLLFEWQRTVTPVHHIGSGIGSGIGGPCPPNEKGYGLYLMDTDGGTPELVKENAFAGEISFDGTKLMSCGPMGVYISDVDGSAEKLILRENFICGSGSPPRFNPRNSSEILITDKRGTISTVSIDGTNRKVVLRGVPVVPAPRYAPDGEAIVFSSFSTATGGPRFNIAKVRPDGTGLVQLTNAPAYTYFWEPSYSPDGRTIAFTGKTIPAGSSLRR